MYATVEAASLAVIGSGGHGREVAFSINRAHPGALRGIYDDAQPDASLMERVGARWLGAVPEQIDGPTYVGIGNPGVRERLAERVRATTPALVDPSAVVGDDVELGDAAIVFPLAAVTTAVTIGRHTHVGRHADVSHDCTIGDFVTLMPGVRLGGHVTIGSRTVIGAGAVVTVGVTVGADVVVAPGAVVTRDVADGSRVS